MCFSVTIAVPSFEEYPLNTDAAGSAPPDAFGPFRVLHQIGAGALGPVFRAYQPEQDRLVAVKLFRLGLPPERTHQLVAELERVIAADLTHPGIAAPLATGINDVSAYLAMDFVAADSLDIVVRDEGPSAPADVVRVVTQLGNALDLAAAIGILHGALHPRDVLLSQDDVRMTGMGVVRALEQVGFEAPIRRPYTAPERTAGAAWDRRADVFSLAALAYELLTRRRIAGAGDQAAESIGDVAGTNAEAVRRAFSRALAEDPADRFATAGDFAKAVQTAFEKKRSVSARAPSNGRTVQTEPLVEAPAFSPVSAEELPLLTDEMLSADRGASPPTRSSRAVLASLDLARPSRGSGRPEPLEGRDDRERVEGSGLELPPPVAEGSPDQSALLMFATAHHPDDLALKADRPQFDVDEVFEPDVAEAPAHRAPFESTETVDRSPSGVWPLMLALVVGIALGFGMAMLLLGRDRVPAPPQEAAAPQGQSAPAEIRDEPIREFTERAVPEVPRPSAPPPAKPPVAAALERPAPASPKPPPPRPSVATPSAKPPVGRSQVPKPSSATTPPSRSTTRPAAAAKPAPAPAAKSGPGSLVVDSRPAGASVFLDGKLIGTTPLVVSTVGVGEYAIRLDRDGYRRWATTVRIASGERSKVAASLERYNNNR